MIALRERIRKELEKVGDPPRLRQEGEMMDDMIREEETKMTGGSSGSGLKRDRGEGKEGEEKEKEGDMEIEDGD